MIELQGENKVKVVLSPLVQEIARIRKQFYSCLLRNTILGKI